jgi:hypothetical protein
VIRGVGYPDEPAPTLGDILSLFGSPTCVVPPPTGMNRFYLLYLSGDTKPEIVIRGDALSWETPVQYILISGVDLRNRPCQSLPSQNYVDWQGLTALARYQNKPN